MDLFSNFRWRFAGVAAALLICLGGPDFAASEAPDHVERQRIRLRAHFRAVLRDMEKRDVSGLSASQRANRLKRMDDLREYAHRGRFPLNVENPGRTLPYIRDFFGTLCAMAYLMDRGGAGRVVNRLARENNHVYMNDIKGGPVLAWLKAHGLTRAEAARIQPRYDHMRRRPIQPRPLGDGRGDGLDSGYYRRGLQKGVVYGRFRTHPSLSYHQSMARLTLFVGGEDGLYARRIASNRLLWKAETKAPVIATPVVVGGRVYANVKGLGIGAWDVDTGRRIKFYRVPGGAKGSPVVVRFNGHLIAAGGDGRVHFFNLESGESEHSVRLSGKITGSPILAAGKVIIATESMVTAMSRHDGRIAWRAKIDGPMTHAPAVIGHRLFIPAGTGVRVLNAGDGRVLRDLEAKDDILRVRALHHDKLMALTAGGGILVFDVNRGDVITRAAPRIQYAGLAPALAGIPFPSNMIRKPITRGPGKRRPRFFQKADFLTGISAGGVLRAHPLRPGLTGWTVRLDGPMTGAAIVPDGRSFIITDARGGLYRISREGRIIMKIKQSRAFTSRPVLAD